MKSLQLEKPHAIIAVGIQGSGKTFFAEKFAQTFNAPLLNQSEFANAARDNKTAAMLFDSILREMLKTGRSIVVELSIASRSERLELANVLKKAGYVPMFVWVQVDLDTAMNRAYRAQGVGQAEYMESMKRFTPMHSSEGALVISGKHTFATQAKAILKRLSVPRNPLPPVERKTPQRGQIIVR